MKKTMSILLFMALFAVVSSCKEDEIILENSQANEILSRSINDFSDVLSDEYKSKIQSDKEFMLIDQIIFRDSMYLLNLSANEAKDLCIPDSLYAFYLQLVTNLNKNE
ncbi:hypothetical protein [Bacteroides neonati]|uniref:hypothetical protein n=1 Tax=Bacteroides neonati TaxID=1347393 RepID=UPI0004B72478|nr:hypothetical protein [Bacteroides neonati]